MTHLVGEIDWLITESSVCRMYFASSRHAEISKYLQCPDLAGFTPAAATAGELEAKVLPIFSRAGMNQNELSRSET